MTTIFNISVEDGDFGWSQNFTDADEALRCVAASLYHDEHPAVIRCDDGDVKVMSPSELPAGITLEEALVELDAYYRELSYTDEAEFNGWGREVEPVWVEANLIPIGYADTRKFEAECDEWSAQAEAYAQTQLEETYCRKPLLVEPPF